MCRHLDILAGHGGWLLFAILFVGASPSGQYDVWAAWLAVQVPAYRRADGERRQQLKWLYSGAAVTLIAFIFGAFIIPIARGGSRLAWIVSEPAAGHAAEGALAEHALAEHALAGGNVAAGVVRVGGTVRKPAGFWTPAVEALLAFLEARGFSGAPRPLGRDDQERQVLEYVPGPMAIDQPPLDAAGLHRVGRLIRDLHDASAGFSPPPGARWNVAIPPDRADLVCHHDLAPWNLVTGADRWVFIDWDGAGPGSRLWDLAYAVKGFVPLEDGGDPVLDGSRLRAMTDGYELSAGQRSRLPALIGAHTRGMADLLENGARTGAQPWARLHAEGHFTYWTASADYIDRHLATWRRALG